MRRGLLLVGSALMGCGSADDARPSDAGVDIAETPDTPRAEDAAERLARHLTGTFDSAEQAASDPAYFDIHLTVCSVDVPALGPRVLYVEQARADMLGAPYRQRLYVVEPREPAATRALSRVFELKRPAVVRGLCRDTSRVIITLSDVEEKSGCGVELTWESNRFAGGTVGKGCASTLNGAAYTSSVVAIDAAGMKSWDRGFTRDDKQVWGATAGPYIFVRRSPLPY